MSHIYCEMAAKVRKHVEGVMTCTIIEAKL